MAGATFHTNKNEKAYALKTAPQSRGGRDRAFTPSCTQKGDIISSTCWISVENGDKTACKRAKPLTEFRPVSHAGGEYGLAKTLLPYKKERGFLLRIVCSEGVLRRLHAVKTLETLALGGT
jgi:hypothetical protein